MRDPRSATAGQLSQPLRRQPEHRVRGPRRRPDRLVLKKIVVDQRDRRRLVPDRRHAADGEAGGVADEIGVGADDAFADLRRYPLSSTRLAPEATTRTGRFVSRVRKISDLAICATVQPTAAAASAAVRVPASNSSTS